MTDSHGDLAAHYAQSDLLQRIDRALEAMSKDGSQISFHDLAPVDEFHIGGRPASERLFSAAGLDPSDHVLDIGCGLGGTARLLAGTYGCRVSGVDLTEEFVEVGTVLTQRVGLDSLIQLQQANACDLPFPESHFSAASMLHVGMNVPNKNELFREVHRVLQPGGRFLIYDIASLDGQDLLYPLPWASDPDHSHLATPSEYQQALGSVGFREVTARSRQQFAIDFLTQVAERQRSGPPSPLGLHLVMGADAATKMANLRNLIIEGRVAPFELFGAKSLAS